MGTTPSLDNPQGDDGFRVRVGETTGLVLAQMRGGAEFGLEQQLDRPI